MHCELVVPLACFPRCPLTPTFLVTFSPSPGLSRTERRPFILEVSTSSIASNVAGLFVHLSGFPPNLPEHMLRSDLFW